MAPRDPILGVTEAFVADTNPEQGQSRRRRLLRRQRQGAGARMRAPRRAETRRGRRAAQLPADRRPAGLRPRSPELSCSAPTAKRYAAGRIVTVQTLGGTGGLKVGADLLRRIDPGAQVWISDPSWENHRALFEYAGFTVNNYPYYDAATHGVELRRHAGDAAQAARRRDRRAARVLPQPDRRRSVAGAMGTRDRSRQCARPRALPRYRLPGIRRRARCRRCAVRRFAAGLPDHRSSRVRSRNRCRSTANASARSASRPAAPTRRRAC